ncbi:MAG: hypothetical protein WEA09_09480 [Gemmatimonadota bacterium]
MNQPSLRPLDLAVALHLALRPEEGFETVAEVLGIGLGSGHRSVQRLMAAGLVLPHRRAVSPGPLREFLVHGARFAFYPVRGPEAEGVPTAHSAPPLRDHIESGRAIVWPSPDGSVRGESLLPLYHGAPGLAGTAPELYELLTLVDAIRVGRARERKLAAEALEAKLEGVDA